MAHAAHQAGLSAEAVAAALLHDTVEDTKVTYEDLAREFPPRVVELVHLLTQWWPDDAPHEVKHAERPKYYAAILADQDAINIKLLDRADNLRDMAKVVRREPKWARKYLTRSEEELKEVFQASENEVVRGAFRDALAALRSEVE